ncbi:MAG TPA: class I SAM-dependent methyltransferase [Gaiellaceae bacterium]|jgi:2-polyprenyl-3-methyl-5-hydroxy-6-metoxy-1,4-benzoquinol methylase
MSVNESWARWRHSFVPDATRTLAETEFLVRRLPLAGFRRVLDACCGRGRHARELARRGYRVLGVDLDETAIVEAERLESDAEFLQLDVRELASLDREFDAVFSLGQTFGLFDAETNAAVLGAMRERVRPGGRIVLDAFDRRFLAEAVTAETGRFRIHLEDGGEFEWMLYTPDEMQSLADALGLRVLLTCSSFSEESAADGTTPRFQVVLERPA